jgi:hypothetical protein
MGYEYLGGSDVTNVLHIQDISSGFFVKILTYNRPDGPDKTKRDERFVGMLQKYLPFLPAAGS